MGTDGRTAPFLNNFYPVPTSDGTDPKFTSQVRDSESGLDFFNARYASFAQGRFTGADPANAGADPQDPQTWNGYAYVRNKPLTDTDPDGMASEQPGYCDVYGGDPHCNIFYNPISGILNVFNMFAQTAQQVQQFAQPAIDWLSRLNGNCVTGAAVNAINVGGSVAVTGAAVGAIAGGGVGDAVTIPAGAAIASVGAGGAALVGGLMNCKVGSGAGGGGKDADVESGGSKKPTPKTDPDKFRSVKGRAAKVNTETGEVYVKDPSQHGGEHYEVYRNMRDFENGVRDHQVWADGTVGKSYK